MSIEKQRKKHSISAAKMNGIILRYIGLLFGTVIFIMPFLWMLRTALMQYHQIQITPIVWFPSPVEFHNFSEALSRMNFMLLLRNTLVITGFTIVGQILSCSIVAFGFARLKFPLRDFLFALLISTMMLPAMVTEIPRFILFRHFNWIDTFYPLIIPAFFSSPFFVFLLRQFFLTLPFSLDEAARIDGASTWRIFWQIILPLSKPVMATVVIFSFIWTWNDFWGPLIYLRSEDMQTLQLGLQVFQGVHQTETNLLMAASLVVIIPILAIYVFFQKYFTEGIVMSGMKS